MTMIRDLNDELEKMRTARSPKKKRYRLSDVKVHEVSVVDSPANNKPFFLLKRSTSDLMDRLNRIKDEIEEETGEEVDIMEVAVLVKRLENLRDSLDEIGGDTDDMDEAEREFQALSKSEREAILRDLRSIDAHVSLLLDFPVYVQKLKTEGDPTLVEAFAKDSKNLRVDDEGNVRFLPYIEELIKFKPPGNDKGYWTTDALGSRVFKTQRRK